MASFKHVTATAQSQLSRLVSRLTASDWLLIGIITCCLMAVGLVLGRWVDERFLTGAVANTAYRLMIIMNAGLLSLAITWLIASTARLRIWQIALIAFLVVWYFDQTSWQFWTNVVRGLFAVDGYSQLLVTLLGLGMLGLAVCLGELAKNFAALPSQKPRYWPLLARHGSWPSFTGMGALLLTGVTRLWRDQALVACFIVSWVLLGAVINAFAFNTVTVFLSLALLITLMVVSRLNFSADQLAIKAGYLPLSAGTISFSFTFSGLLTMGLWSYMAATALSLSTGSWVLTLIVLTGFTIGTLVARLFNLAEPTGELGRWWSVALQALAVTTTYTNLIHWQPLTILLVLIAALSGIVVVAVYQGRPRSVTMTG